MEGPIWFRWTQQGRSDGREHNTFSVMDHKGLRERAAYILHNYPPDSSLPLTLEVMRRVRHPATGAHDVIWTRIGPDQWPHEPSVVEEQLALLAEQIVEQARQLQVGILPAKAGSQGEHTHDQRDLVPRLNGRV